LRLLQGILGVGARETPVMLLIFFTLPPGTQPNSSIKESLLASPTHYYKTLLC
jgi:hypothetical protein